MKTKYIKIDFKDTEIDIVYNNNHISIVLGDFKVNEDSLDETIYEFWEKELFDFGASSNNDKNVISFIRTFMDDKSTIEDNLTYFAQSLYDNCYEFKQDIQEHAEWVFREE